MRAVTKIIFFDDSGEKFFGEGPCRLLTAVEETGSLRAAALSMGMAYSKALKLVKNAEAALGFSPDHANHRRQRRRRQRSDAPGKGVAEKI